MRLLGACYFFFLHLTLGFAESTLPSGCQAIAVQGASVTLEAAKNSLIYIHNLTSADLWIVQEASAGWTSHIQAENWSALSMKKGSLILNCIESIPGHEQQVPCEGVIAICKWKKVKVPANAPGTFWVAEDMSLRALTAAIGGRGFVIP